jgi:UDP-N-acetylmuramoylalanine--D-glutamate ligase
MKNPLADYLAPHKLLIWGFGKEGLSTYRFLRRHFPDKPLTVADDRSEELRADPALAADPHLRFWPAAKGQPPLQAFDLVLKSPGIATAGLDLGELANRITGQADLFLQFAPGRIVGITGTKGKSTTSFLLAHLLRSSGIDVYLGGNCGVPLWDFIDELEPGSITVAELSSYQLEYALHSPTVAVWLNLYQEHLNYHGSFPAYREAKANIARFLGASHHLVHRSDDPSVAVALDGLRIAARRHPFSAETPFPYSLEGNRQLPGVHNRLNALAAITAGRLVGLREEAIQAGLDSFVSLPHRLEYLGSVNGVRYYNDSISTVPEATLAALAALPETDILILGGMNRGVSYDGLARALRRPRLRHVLLMPETGAIVDRLLQQHIREGDGGFSPHLEYVQTLEEAVVLAGRYARAGGTCLFSPAASSYHRYKNFEERGEAFRALVHGLGPVEP